MTVKKSKKPSPPAKRRSGAANGKVPSYQESIRRHLSTVPGVDAVYIWVDSRKIVQVTSVVKEHDSEIYDWLIPAENQVEKESPRTYFDFHVRARQRRTVEDAVPPGCLLIFKK